MSSTVTMDFPELPHYLTVKATVDGDKERVSVSVESSIHVKRESKMSISFTMGYVETYPTAFRNEVLAYVVKKYGLKADPLRYH